MPETLPGKPGRCPYTRNALVMVKPDKHFEPTSPAKYLPVPVGFRAAIAWATLLMCTAILLLVADPAVAQAPATQTMATEPDNTDARPAEAEVRSLVATLQDTAAREALTRQLELLLKAQKENSTEEDTGISSATATGVYDKATESLQATWRKIRNVDPLWLLKNMFLSLVAAAALIAAYFVLRKVLRLISTASASAIKKSAGDKKSVDKSGIEPPRLLLLFLKLFSGFAFLVVLGNIWSDGETFWIAQWIGDSAGGATAALMFVFLAALLLWHATDAAIEYVIRGKAKARLDGRQATRIESLIPQLKGVMRLAIAVLAALLMLSELGFNIGPLLAGAGIVGLAIGFGAQSLVKDLLTGISMLIEDSAAVGDIVEIQGNVGRVENMDLRVLRLRALDGAFYTIPYSEVTTIKNLTKVFSYHLFEIGVAYKEDIDDVIKEIHDVAKQLADDTEFNEIIIGETEIFGLDSFGDSAIIIKGRIKTKPSKQWQVGREFNRRIKRRFDEQGIEIPFPHMTLFLGTDKAGEAAAGRINVDTS